MTRRRSAAPFETAPRTGSSGGSTDASPAAETVDRRGARTGDRSPGRLPAPLARFLARCSAAPLTVQLTWLFASLGIVFRVAQYAADRSLWHDEAALALNLIEKPWSGLFGPLSLDQGAPIGFLLVEKLARRDGRQE